MNISKIFKRLVYGDNAMAGRSGILRTVVVWAFIALVALFLTQPAGEPASIFDRPIPLPAELGLEPPPSFAAAPVVQPRALAASACRRIVSKVAFGVIRLPS